MDLVINGKELVPHPKFEECYIDEDGGLWTVSSGELEKTRESWERRKKRGPVSPERTVPKSPDLERLAKQVALAMRQGGVEPTEYHKKAVLKDAVTKVMGQKEGSTKALGNLWRAGYVQRIGSTYKQTGRPYNTLWRILPDYAGRPQNNVKRI